MATRGIWVGEPNTPEDYDEVLTSITDLGGSVTDVQAAVLRFIAQYTSGAGTGPVGPVSTAFASITGTPTDNPALAQAFTALGTQLRNEITNGAGAAFEAIEAIRDLLADGSDASAALLNGLAARLRFDASQPLTDVQKAQAALNLGIATRLLPTNGVAGQIPIVTADGSVVWGFPSTGGVISPIDPLVVQATTNATQVSGAMRLRALSIGTE